MLFPFSTLFLTLLLGGGTDLTGTRTPHRPISQDVSNRFHYVVEPPVAELRVGDRAPNFAYQGYEGHWMRLHHLVDQGPVLLVLGWNEEQLVQLEREREELLQLGVIPVAIVDRKPGKARTIVRTLKLKFTVLADPRLVIAWQFNVAESGRITPSWFVIDRRARVRALSRTHVPAEAYTRLCARALALPMPGTLVPTSH